MPRDGAETARPVATSRSTQRASSSSVRCPVALAARRSAGTRRTSAATRLHPSASPVAVSSRRLAHVQPEPDRDPLRGGAAPSRLDQHSGELTPADVQVVRPLHADRLRRQAVERLGHEQSAAEREHVERARVARALDQREPDAAHRRATSSADRGVPRPAVCSSARTSVPAGADGRRFVRDVERRGDRARTPPRVERRAAPASSAAV